jgi:hypothetical protein
VGNVSTFRSFIFFVEKTSTTKADTKIKSLLVDPESRLAAVEDAVARLDRKVVASEARVDSRLRRVEEESAKTAEAIDGMKKTIEDVVVRVRSAPFASTYYLYAGLAVLTIVGVVRLVLRI